MFNNTIITIISSLLGIDAESAQLQTKHDLFKSLTEILIFQK